jgi:hypothetical protein
VTVVMHADSTSASGQNTHLDWIDLEATSQVQGVGWGEFARNGDPNPAIAYPFVSHDGTKIVYASAPSANPSGILQHGDLYTVEYGARVGGAAAPLSGADTKTYSEFYPAYSPDDRLVAYYASARRPGQLQQRQLGVPDHWGRRRDADTARGQRSGDVPRKDQPRDHQQLAQVVSGGRRCQWPDLLLDHLLVDPERESAALRGGRYQGRDRPGHHDAGPLFVEPAAHREQPHPRLGHLLHPTPLNRSYLNDFCSSSRAALPGQSFSKGTCDSGTSVVPLISCMSRDLVSRKNSPVATSPLARWRSISSAAA